MIDMRPSESHTALFDDDNSIPKEIDEHFQRFGMEPWEVNYDLFGYCSICNTRIDEFGYCACGGPAD